MTSIAEAFKAEMLARLLAAPAYGVNLARVRRSHLTHIAREQAPAVYLQFAKAHRSDDASCAWRWEMEWTVAVFVRDDNDAAADPIVLAVLQRLDPTAGAGYANGVDLTLDDIESDSELADLDAQRVDVKGTAHFLTKPWRIDEAP